YISSAVFLEPARAGAGGESSCVLSFSISSRGFPLDFFDAEVVFFCFLGLGGVLERLEMSSFESSSLSGFARFLAPSLLVRVDCVSFFGAAFGLAIALAFGAAFAFAFGFGCCDGRVSARP